MKISGFQILALFLGLLLLVTGSLKTYAVFSDGTVDTFLFASRLETMTIAEFEFFLGGWLIAGFYPRLARLCALMTFLCFLVVSFLNAFRGETSCSCFGVLKASPWIAAAIDAAALIALLLCRSHADGYLPTPSPFRRTLFTISVLSFLVLPMAYAVSGSSQSPLLVPSKPVVDLGVLSPGELQNTSLWLTNEGHMFVEIKKIDSSCHCLTLECSQPLVHPSESVQVKLTLDLGKEPGFIGNLRIHVQGRTRTGASAFALQVRAKVQ